MSNQGSLRGNDQEWTEHTAVKDGLLSKHVSIPITRITYYCLHSHKEGGKVFNDRCKTFQSSRTGGRQK